MSRWIIDNKDGTWGTELADKDMCRYLYDEVCTNDKCEWCADFPSAEDCHINSKGRCPHFEAEEGDE